MNSDRESILIVDESDDVIMKNPKKFAQSILNEKVKVICLTATPDDGLEQGSEKVLIDLLKFKRIFTEKKGNMVEPKIDERAKLPTTDEIMTLVKNYRTSRGVLVYANDPYYSELINDHNLTKVDQNTPDADLRSMDKQTGGLFPVFVINENYGTRGLDYRAPGNPLGIMMIICSPFSDRRSRL